MATIYRPCYVTREEVKRALDVKQSAYNDAQIDENIQSASDSADELCMRVFYPMDDTRAFDWPNYQYAYPWRLWLDQNEIAQSPLTLLSSGGVAIPVANYILRPVWGPPYTYIELRRDLNSSFGNGPSPQLEISVGGTFGFWNKTVPASALAVAVTDTTSTGITATSSAGAGYGTGDVLIAGTERMLVTDAQMVSTGVSFTSGISTILPSDNAITLTGGGGASFTVGEEIQYGSEVMLIYSITGDVLTVKRAWSGSVIAAHTPGVLYARRALTVVRGALGSTAATHLISVPLTKTVAPALVNRVALAEALVGITQEPNAYSALTTTTWHGSAGSTGGQRAEPMPGAGLPDLRDRCATKYGRRARSRVI